LQSPQTLLVFSHLRWSFVHQRPQHLLSRLARHYRVLFVEEPVHGQQPSWDFQRPEENIQVCRPVTPCPEEGFCERQREYLRPLLKDLLRQENVESPLLWFYTPMALPIAEDIQPAVSIYDCMDELSAFLGAPRELLDFESSLYDKVDIVFTGGPSLYRSKRNRHSNVHCFPSSVDIRHFAKSRQGIEEPAEQASLAHPRLGFFGVVDERLDRDLLAAMAESHPEWQIVMIGPVVKIDPETLPRHANIHYLGQKSYSELPAYLAGWDICLLPFAMNESTKFISPTKVLEYMAAEQPIVSSPITDVVEPYGSIVYIGRTKEEFIRACDRALASPAAERTQRAMKMRMVLSQTSWDATAESMHALIEQVSRSGAPRRESAVANERSFAPVSTGRERTVVIGAGPTGLSAAYHLGEDALLVEKNDSVGGWCRSVEDRGFTFDFAGHIMFSNEPYVHKMYQMLLGDNVHWQDREAWVYSKGVYTRYPFQGALYGLPPEVIKECILGAIEARFGKLDTAKPAGANGQNTKGSNGKTNGHSQGNGNGGMLKGAVCKTDSIEDCCADGVLESSAPLGASGGVSGAGTAEPRNFEEFIYKVWGAGIAKHFAIPYNRKLWAVPLSEMETSWLGGRVPLPNLDEMIEGALRPVPKPMGPNARFGYPLRGGFQALMNGFLPHLEAELRLNTSVAKVSPSRRTVTLSDGREVRYGHLISTMPLPQLVRVLGDEAPGEIRAAAARLRYVSVRCVNIGVGREKLTEKHWIYYPEDTVFHRIFVQGNASPHCNPQGGFGLTCEITYSEHKPLPCDGEALIQRCIEDCRRVGVFGKDDPIWTANQIDMPYAYVVYDHGRKQNVAMIRECLSQQDILLAGRYSEWEYYNSDHAFIAGKKAAEQVRARESAPAVLRTPELKPTGESLAS
jgi:UDP-galactopyranose mutase